MYFGLQGLGNPCPRRADPVPPFQSSNLGYLTKHTNPSRIVKTGEALTLVSSVSEILASQL